LKAPKLGFAVDTKAPRELAAINPLTYQAVYLFQVPAPDETVWSTLLGIVRQGIGLGIVLGGEETKTEFYKGPAAQLVMPGRLEFVKQGKDDGKTPGAIWNLEDDNVFQHPFMSPFRAWKENDVVKNPSEAFSFWAVEPHDKEALVIVSYKDGDKNGKERKMPAIVERILAAKTGKPGRILLFTTPLDVRRPRWNNYLESKSSMYVVLAGLATNYLAGDTEAPKLNFIAGQEEPMVALPLAARFPSYTLSGPDQPENQIAAPEKQGELKLRQAEAPGNYLVKGWANDVEANKPVVAAFSVNVPAEESDLTRVPVGEIESLLGPGAVIPADRKANLHELFQDHWSEPLELFPLLMVIVLVILAVENLLANKFYRRDTNEGN
jgi:hypothetical protein